MKRMLIAAALAGMALLGGCALLPDSSVTADAKKAVVVALTTYTQVYQPVVIAYGHLPVCPVQAPQLCHDRDLFAKLAAADAVVNTTAKAAKTVMDQNVGDPNALQNVVTAIQTAQLQIAASGLLTKKDQ